MDPSWASSTRHGGRLAIILALVPCVLVLIGGCSGERATASDSTVPPAPTPGGTLRLILERPSSLDPAEGGSVYEALPVNQIFDGLVTRDAGTSVVPELASSWTISHGGLEYEFELRPGVRFHDGTPFTAADVVYTFERLLDPDREEPCFASSYVLALEGAEEYARGEADGLTGVRAVDESTIHVRLRHPVPAFLEALTLDGLRIVPRHLLEGEGAETFRIRPVGTGPFRLESWDEDRLRLTANRDYFGGPPHLDGVEILFPREDEVDWGASRFFRRELHVIEPQTEFLPRLAADPGTRTYRYQELSLSFLGIGTGNPPLDRIEVRQAIAHAIDRSVLIADSPVLRREAVGILPPGFTGYSPARKVLEWDPRRSRELLSGAGYGPDNPPPPIELLTVSLSASARKTLERIESDLLEVGIRLDETPVSWGELDERINAGTAPLFLLGWIADLTDPDDFLRSGFESGAPGNPFGFSDAETDRMLKRATLELDPVRRARLCTEIERRILERAPLVPLYHSLGIIAVRTEVHGFEPGPFGVAAVPLENVWIENGGEVR